MPQSLFRQRITSLEEEILDLRESNAYLRADLDDQKRLVLSADAERQRYEKKYRDCKKQLAPLTKQRDEEMSRAEKLFLANTELNVNLHEQERKLKRVHGDLDALADDLEDAQALVERYKSQGRKVSRIVSTTR